MSTEEDQSLKEFSENIISLWTDASKKYGRELRKINVYPRVHHDVNKFFYAKGSNSYRVLRLANMGLLRKVKASPVYTVDVKSKAYEFAKRCGIKCPEALMGLKLDELSFDKFMISKPVFSNGGKCIYAWQKLGDGTYFDYFSKKKANTVQDIIKIMRNEFVFRRIAKDEWIQEEIIVGKDGTPKTTLDVKFYAFYGKIACVLQVDRWDKRDYTFFDLNGQQVDTGRYPYRDAVEAKFDSELINIATELSKKVPWPHVRLDFLVSDNDYAFGEFSSEPGNFSEFNNVWDTKLAMYYQSAFERLYNDFLSGKKFPEYEQCFGPFKKI